MEWYHVWWPWLTSKRVAWFVSDSKVSCLVGAICFTKNKLLAFCILFRDHICTDCCFMTKVNGRVNSNLQLKFWQKWHNLLRYSTLVTCCTSYFNEFVIPVWHLTETSLRCSQLCLPHLPCEQYAMSVSSPLQSTSSNQIGPLPAP